MDLIILKNEYIPRIISQFLNANDAISFSCTCKSINESLGFEIDFDDYDNSDEKTRTGHIWHKEDSYVTFLPRGSQIYREGNDDLLDDLDDGPQYYKEILSNVSLVNVHSIQLSLTWKDQGWGNRKGTIYVIRSTKNMASQQPLSNTSNLFSSGDHKILYESPAAPHEAATLTASIPLLKNNINSNVDESYIYSIWVFVGDGGGHELYIKDVSIKYLVYTSVDTNEKPFKQRQKLLRTLKHRKNDALRFCVQLFKQVYSFTRNDDYDGRDDDTISFIVEVKSQLKKFINENGRFEHITDEEQGKAFVDIISKLIHTSSEQENNINFFDRFMKFSPTQIATAFIGFETKVHANPSTKELTFDISTNELRHVQDIPVLSNSHETYSIEVSCQWKDQGWGYRKGTLYIIRNKTRGDVLRPNDIIYTSPVAEHHYTTLLTTFTPEKSSHPSIKNTYSIWCQVGGGGGHKLYIKDLLIRFLTYDESSKIPFMLHQELLHNLFEKNGIFFYRLLKEVCTLFCADSNYCKRLMDFEQLVEDDQFFRFLNKSGLIGFSDAHVNSVGKLLNDM